jgi:hypothetical protein
MATGSEASGNWQDVENSIQAFDSLEDPIARNRTIRNVSDDDDESTDGQQNCWDSGGTERMRDDSEISQKVIFYDTGETKL